jgi:hypothetical protein
MLVDVKAAGTGNADGQACGHSPVRTVAGARYGVMVDDDGASGEST